MADTTPEMVARVADAIRTAANGLDGDTIGTMLHENFRVEVRGDDLGTTELAIVCEAAARAAIAAMREPTCGVRRVVSFEVAEIDWPKMIDTALTAPPPPSDQGS